MRYFLILGLFIQSCASKNSDWSEINRREYISEEKAYESAFEGDPNINIPVYKFRF